MNQSNSLIIEGNCVNEKVEVLEPKPGFHVAKFSVGVNRYYKNAMDENVNEVSYFDIEAYGKMAEFASSKLEKGMRVRIVGRLKQDRWSDDDGVARSKVYVVAEHIEYYNKPKTKEVEVQF